MPRSSTIQFTNDPIMIFPSAFGRPAFLHQFLDSEEMSCIIGSTDCSAQAGFVIGSLLTQPESQGIKVVLVHVVLWAW